MATRPAGGWLQGRTVRKGGGSATNARTSSSSTPTAHSNSSSTIYGGGVKDPSGRTAEYFSMDDQCPVCKSDRYLNPKLRLLVSTPCYHKMCESCIDRLFTLGPAPCPICNTVLRKLAFTPQTFEDLGVEKEVSIRKRMAREFNKRKEDFADLRSYNDYLEMVEDIAFNLINGVDIPETEARIAAYRAENAALIELNIQREQDYANALKEQEELERREREQRALDLRLEEEGERQEREHERQKIIDRLESSDKDASEVIKKARAKMRKNLRREEEERKAQAQARLLRSRTVKGVAVKDVPHVPLTDNYYAYEDAFQLLQTYNDLASDAVRYDREGIMRAGGYIVSQAWERAIRTSVAGLDIMPLEGLPSTEPADVAMAS